jgi:choline dehydrogenase-like flavoprotein
MLSSEWEIYTMREALKMIQRWSKADAWDGKILEPLQNFTTDEEFDEWARQETRMANHPCGGAQISAEDADYGVVNPNLSVKGLSDLFVIDSSIFVRTPLFYLRNKA